jgi:hypothetical protein
MSASEDKADIAKPTGRPRFMSTLPKSEASRVTKKRGMPDSQLKMGVAFAAPIRLNLVRK